MNDSHNAEIDRGAEMTSERLGENLRRAIKASGLTQAEVAERCEMDPTALSTALAGTRKLSSLELALICTATGSDVLGVLGAEPLHGPSYRQGYQEAVLHMRRAHEAGDLERIFLPHVDPDGDYTGCGAKHPDLAAYCDLPIHPWPATHHADLFWENGSWSDDEGRHVPATPITPGPYSKPDVKSGVQVVDLGDDPDGDMDEQEAIAAAREAGHGYQPTCVTPPVVGQSDG